MFKLGALAASFTTPSKAPEPGGKSYAGGNLGGSAGAADVGISVINLADLRSGRICGGVVGKGKNNKMCVIENCTVVSHATKAIVNDTWLRDAGVFIEAPGAAGKTVFHTPVVPPGYFGDKLDVYVHEYRSVPFWETLFSSLLGDRQPDGPGGEQFDKLVERIGRNVDEPYGKTPMKKRPKLDVSSPGLEDGFESVYPIIEEDISGGGGVNEELQSQWKLLIKTLNLMRGKIEGCREHMKRQTDATKSEFAEVDFELASLGNLVGSKPPSMETGSIVSLLVDTREQLEAIVVQQEALAEEQAKQKFPIDPTDLKNFKDFLDGYDVHHPDNGTYAQQVERLVDNLNKILVPLMQFSDDCSNLNESNERVGLKVVRELADLKRKVDTLLVSSNANQAPPTNPGVSFRFGSMSFQQGQSNQAPAPAAPAPTNSNSADYGALLVELQTMKDRVQALEDQVASNQVVLGAVTFKSLTFLSAWLQTQALGPGAWIYFLDAPSFLNYAHSDASTSEEILAFRSSAAKGGFGSPEEAAIAASFQLTLPPFYGKDSKSNSATNDTRSLPAMKSFQQFDHGDGFNGARWLLIKQVDNARRALLEGARNSVPPSSEAYAVVNQTICDSAAFLIQLNSWMSQQYADLKGRGGNPDDCWKLISHCVRAIFTDLQDARIAGKGPFPPNMQHACIVWGHFQGHRRMKEYMRTGFSAHPTLSYILNLHLQDNAVMKSVYNNDERARGQQIAKLRAWAQAEMDIIKADVKSKFGQKKAAEKK